MEKGNLLKELEELKERSKNLAINKVWGVKAIEINERIIELDTRYSDAYTRLAKCYILIGDRVKAIKLYEQVLKFDEKNNIARNGIQRLDSRLRIVSDETKDKLGLNKTHSNYYIFKRSFFGSGYGMYVNHCYHCKREVNSDMQRCGKCGWYICETCGACGCDFYGHR